MKNKEIREKVESTLLPYWGVPNKSVQDKAIDQIMQIVEESVKKERERIKLCAKEQSCSMCMEWLSSLKKV